MILRIPNRVAVLRNKGICNHRYPSYMTMTNTSNLQLKLHRKHLQASSKTTNNTKNSLKTRRQTSMMIMFTCEILILCYVQFFSTNTYLFQKRGQRLSSFSSKRMQQRQYMQGCSSEEGIGIIFQF